MDTQAKAGAFNIFQLLFVFFWRDHTHKPLPLVCWAFSFVRSSEDT